MPPIKPISNTLPNVQMSNGPMSAPPPESAITFQEPPVVEASAPAKDPASLRKEMKTGTKEEIVGAVKKYSKLLSETNVSAQESMTGLRTLRQLTAHNDKNVVRTAVWAYEKLLPEIMTRSTEGVPVYNECLARSLNEGDGYYDEADCEKRHPGKHKRQYQIAIANIKRRNSQLKALGADAELKIGAKLLYQHGVRFDDSKIVVSKQDVEKTFEQTENADPSARLLAIKQMRILLALRALGDNSNYEKALAIAYAHVADEDPKVRASAISVVHVNYFGYSQERLASIDWAKLFADADKSVRRNTSELYQFLKQRNIISPAGKECDAIAKGVSTFSEKINLAKCYGLLNVEQLADKLASPKSTEREVALAILVREVIYRDHKSSKQILSALTLLLKTEEVVPNLWLALKLYKNMVGSYAPEKDREIFERLAGHADYMVKTLANECLGVEEERPTFQWE